MRLNNAVVLDVKSNVGKGAFSGRNFYTVTVKSDIGDPVVLDWGSKTPPSAGITINVECEDTVKYGKHRVVNSGSVGGGSFGGPSAPPGASPRPSFVPVGAFPIAKDSREISIIRQNALTNARGLLHEHFNVFFPKSVMGINGEGGELPTEDEFLKKLVEVAFWISEFSSGALEVDASTRLMDKLKA